MTGPVRLASVLGCALGIVLTCAQRGAEAQDSSRVAIVLEGVSVWSNRNDVRIPPDEGTEFLIVDLVGTGPDGAVRVEATVELAERHGLRVVYAPVRISGRGTPEASIFFAGEQFAAIPTDAEYQFDSYRVTYRYRFYNGETWRWKVGFTGS